MGNSSDAKSAPKSCADDHPNGERSSSKERSAPDDDRSSSEPSRRRMFRFKSRRDVAESRRAELRKSLSYFASLTAHDGEGNADAGENTKHTEAQLSWADLWRDISIKGTVGPEDADALLACERWRRSAHGEKHDGWYKILVKFRHPYWERLTASIRAGVPSVLRGVVWYACSGAAPKKKETSEPFAGFVVEAQGLEGTEAARVIENDIPRTGVEGERKAALRNILYAFAVKNPDIGYCQSMNFLVATFLLYNTEEQSFWILCSLIEDLLPKGYYTQGMTGLRTDLKVFDSLIAQYLPELHKHFASSCIDLSPITMNWFLCLFVNTLPPDSSHKVMDCLLHEGSKVLFRTALSILRIREQELLNSPSVMDAYLLLRVPFGTENSALNLHAPAASADLIANIYGPWLKGFSNDTLAKLRKEHGAVIQAEDEERDRLRREYDARKAAQAKADSGEQELAAELGGDVVSQPESPSDALKRQSTLFLVPPSIGDNTRSFGYLGRAADDPQTAATWLSTVIGQNVEEEGEED